VTEPVSPPPFEAPARLPFEAHARAAQTPGHWLAGAVAGERWAIGREITRAEFDAAITRVATMALR